MAEYIDKELARQVICGWCEYDTCPGYDYYWDKCDAKRRLDDIPSVDVQPVVHGHWIVRRGNYNEEFECSVCRHISKDGGNYCGNCGADMRGVDDG